MSISRQLLSEAALTERLAQFPNWEIKKDFLYRKFQFPDFATAWVFMQVVASGAEAIDHHPDWRNVYNKVEIRLSTHDAGGITALDFALARLADEAF